MMELTLAFVQGLIRECHNPRLGTSGFVGEARASQQPDSCLLDALEVHRRDPSVVEADHEAHVVRYPRCVVPLSPWVEPNLPELGKLL
jgi:hypothetical protein